MPDKFNQHDYIIFSVQFLKLISLYKNSSGTIGLVGFILQHMKPCELFQPISCLYLYIKYI